MGIVPARMDPLVENLWQLGFDAHYGLEMLEIDAERVVARVPVRPELLQPTGLVHGGVYAAIAESMASLGTGVGVYPDLVPQGLSNQTSFMRPILEGFIHATAVRRHRGRTTWIWDVELADDQGRLCAVSRMTIAVRSPRP
ncbi:MAG: thioesterase superfamily protein [Solirubrobacterales bacterium]|nr:thioesterase superfamily protein [Solirubrobacterales bacterium]